MAFELTNNARNASRENSIELNLVFEIDGVSTIFGAVPIKKFVRIGDPDLEIGDPDTNENAFFIGGFNLVDDQQAYISLDGTTTKIRQQLQIDRGKSAGIPNFQVNLIDKNEFITQLITPDETQTPTFDILGRSCTIKIGFVNTAFPEDYITIFRGIVTDIEPGAGNVKFSINAPDNKKRKTLFKQATTELSSGMGAGDTVANVNDTADFLVKITPPGGGSPTSNFETYFRVNDEVIKYETKTGSQLQTLTRGQFGTTASSHSSGANITSIYQITGNSVDLALEIMLSGFNGEYVKDIPIDSFNVISSTETQADTLVFKETDIVSEHGIVIGDFITTTGATNGANNVTELAVTGIEITSDLDTLLTVEGAGFVNEDPTSATLAIRSQYDVYPDGMKMRGDEVDVDQHLFLRGTFLPTFQYDFRLKEQIDDGKEFLEEQIYSPVAAFSLPRKAKASIGFHSGPIPGQDIATLDDTNVKDGSNIAIRRSTERFFFNEIVYRFDEDILEDRFLSGVITINTDSKDRILNKEKALTISSKGITTALSGPNIATTSSNRRISRYKFGAEFLTVRPLFGTAFAQEVGDIVIFDGSNLQITDIKTGSREFVSRLMEIEQKTLDIKTGSVDIQLVDTNFDGQQRFGLIGPSSNVKTGLSNTQFIIEESFASRFGTNEFQKWEKLVNPAVRVRSSDFTTRNATSTIQSLSGNTVTLSSSLGFTPQPGDVMELADYSALALEVTLVYASISDVGGGDFPDSTPSYVIL